MRVILSTEVIDLEKIGLKPQTQLEMFYKALL